jgi:hypothetical protein
VLAIPQPEEHHTVITVAAGANKVAGPGAELVRMSQIACTSSHQTPSASALVDAEGDQQPLGTGRADVNPEYDLHSRHISAADDGWSVHRSRVTREELDG